MIKLYLTKTQKGYTLIVADKKPNNSIREYTVFDPYLIRIALLNRFKANRRGNNTLGLINPKWIDAFLATDETINNLVTYYYR